MGKVQTGNTSPEQTERNTALYNDWKLSVKQGKLTREFLVEAIAKYQITPARIWAIIKREKERNGFKVAK